MKHIHLIYVVFIVCSCAASTRLTTFHHDLVEIDIPELIQKEVELTTLSRFAQNCSYIPLETTKESIIQYIMQIYSTNHEIIVVDRNACLLFDKQSGKFIRKIGAKGTGPHEYLNIISSSFDEKNEVVYILSSGNRALIGYNLKGQAVHYKPRHDHPIWHIGLIDSLTYAAVIHNSMGDQKGRLLIGNFKSRSTTIVPNHSFFPENQDFHVEGNTMTAMITMYNFDVKLYNYDRKLFLKEAWNDTIFEIKKPNILTPRYVFNLGRLKIPERIRGNAAQIESLLKAQCVGQVTPLETDNYLFFDFRHKDINYACIYCKNSKYISVLDRQVKGSFWGLRNDLKGDIPFWPKYISQKGEMLKWINADVFYRHQKNQDMKILPSLNEEDNPVIMIVR